MIEQLCTRNFILCDVGSSYYAFVHRTFLEYFCAWAYIWKLEAQKYSIEKIKTKVFGNHWQDESWHEVLRLIAGMILEPTNVGEIIAYLMEQDGESANFANLFLAADCLAEVRNRKSIIALDRSLLEKLKQFAKQVRKFSERQTSEFGELIELNAKLSAKVISVIANNWKYNPETLPWLKQRAQSDDNWDVRITAVQELGRGWQDDPDTLPWLKQRAQSDDNWDVRITAVQELGRGWQDDPEMFELLANCAVNDPFVPSETEEKGMFETNPRQTALEGIIEYFPDHPQTKVLLVDRSQNDPDKKVREFARQALDKLSEE